MAARAEARKAMKIIAAQAKIAKKRFVQVKYYKVNAEGEIKDFRSDVPARFKHVFKDLPAAMKWVTQPDPVEKMKKTWAKKGATVASTFPEPKLNTEYLQQFGEAMVTLERTQTQWGPFRSNTFERFEAPLSILISHMAQKSAEADQHPTRLYLAQHSLSDLPAGMQADLPTPSLLTKLGRGDIYASSLWMGRPPVRTPLHRDPNPNLFVQISGKKIVRLFKPDMGQGVYERVKAALGERAGRANIRGEEMMKGREMEALETAVWHERAGDTEAKGLEIELKRGDALYIPLGWWHAVKSQGVAPNISANWWFR